MKGGRAGEVLKERRGALMVMAEDADVFIHMGLGPRGRKEERGRDGLILWRRRGNEEGQWAKGWLSCVEGPFGIREQESCGEQLCNLGEKGSLIFVPQLAHLYYGNNSNIYLGTWLQGFSEMAPTVTGIVSPHKGQLS